MSIHPVLSLILLGFFLYGCGQIGAALARFSYPHNKDSETQE